MSSSKFLNKNDSDIMAPFVDDKNPQPIYVSWRDHSNKNEITPLMSNLDFPDSANCEGNILDPAMQPMSSAKQYA
jgi:hypothetical protein